MSIQDEARKTTILSIEMIEKLAGQTHDKIIEHRRDAIIAQIVQIPA